MDWLELLSQIFDVCIIPLLGVLTAWLISFIKTKRDELIKNVENEKLAKYITMLSDTIATCVTATNQTYVDSLKARDAFDAEAQKEAFNKTFNAVMTILTDEAQVYLTEAYGDLNAYIVNEIEARVKIEK